MPLEGVICWQACFPSSWPYESAAVLLIVFGESKLIVCSPPIAGVRIISDASSSDPGAFLTN
jgi:hypothetical protein